MRIGGRRAITAVGAVLAGFAAFAPGAGAETIGSGSLSSAGVADQSCTDSLLPDGPGVVTEKLTAPSLGLLRVTLDGGAGDWDLGVFDADDGRTVAGAATLGPDEVADGFVLRRTDLVLQACRRGGDDPSASFSVEHLLFDPKAAGVPSLVRIQTPGDDDVYELQQMGIDLTEHGGPGYVEAVLHGPDDGNALTSNGFAYDVQIADLSEQSALDREADAAYARSAKAGEAGLPSGQETYRRLFDYSEDLKELADDNPKLVRHFKMPERTYEDRPVEGIEISKNVRRRNGKPVFLMMGVHHAREWPSGEHAIEWAYELINGFKDGDKRIRRIVKRSRTIIVPIVNPDGFETSREAGELQGGGGGRGGDDTQETANIVSHPYEYRRKNCRLVDDSEAGDCAQPAFGIASAGVDPNRNYGGFWGGPGASTDPTAEDYRGPGPFSEPETRNVRWLVSRNQVTTLITNHTFSQLVLRPPGIQSQGPPPDERIYKKLGASMAAENGYTNQPSYKLYDTTGGTEDWSYYATGGLGFTFEIGKNFHPPFADVVAEYRGTTPEAGAGGGNRAAYFKAESNTLNRKRHSVIKGSAPAGAKLTLSKRFKTKTSPVLDANGAEGDVQKFKDRLRTKLKVGDSGKFTWHVNPSTRPVVQKSKSGPKPRNGQPSDPVTFNGTTAGAIPCGDAESEDELCFNDHPFDVPGGSGVDNGTASVRIQWATVASDWDMQIFRDSDGDGSSVGETNPVGVSQTGTSDSEATTLVRPNLEQGKYVVRVTNFAATEPYDGTVTFGKTPKTRTKTKVERWTLRCRSADGKSVGKVRVGRGGVKHVDLRQACG